MLSKADYYVIARALKKSREAAPLADGPVGRTAVDIVILDIAAALRADNGRFDPEKFLRTCGWSEASIADLSRD